mmetsp:Transcript_102402/g.330394  ORF Transcript_102402/g.330394 Transcript_102402/m.330394 type:complete len:185 (+) Transcript_102402:267-821(+)
MAFLPIPLSSSASKEIRDRCSSGRQRERYRFQGLPLGFPVLRFIRSCRRLLALRSSSGTDTPTQAESYLLSWGLSEQQLDKVRGRYRQNFDPNVEDKVKPLLNWLKDVGLTQLQIQKAVVDFPSLFRCRLEQNMKPSVRWLLEMGLDKSQVAKMIARKPRLCSSNLQRTLKPFVGWLSELGIEK